MNSKKIELLAPAGSYEAFVAAVQNGANAIYLGGSQFSARASATNFTNEEIKEAVVYAHLRKVKIYVTINTLYQEQEYSRLYEYISFLYMVHVDAIIVQDVGVLYLVKKYFPAIEVHMSTQASIYQLAGVKYFEELGIKRVVLARENTIEEINHICHNTNIDIEVFVHGALCVSYSGQCLMSSFIGKRSGNKGSCAQPCRLGYTLMKDKKQLPSNGSFLLSPKDLCTLDNIGELINAGVTSFKIEGRMKRPEYVATIVRSYREAIDAHLNNTVISKKQHMDEIKQMFNRGFTKGPLFNDAHFIAKEYPGNRGIEIGKVLRYQAKSKKVSIRLLGPLKQEDRITFQSNDITRTITKLYSNGKLINNATTGETVEIEMNEPLIINDTVYKIIDSALLHKARDSYAKENIKVPVYMRLDGEIGSYCQLVLSDGKYEIKVKSESLIEKATNHPLSKERIKQQLEKLGSTIYTAREVIVDFDNEGTIAIKELNALRRKGILLLDQKRVQKAAPTIPSFSPLEVTKKRAPHGIAIKVATMEQLEVALTYPATHIFYPINDTLEKAYLLAKKVSKNIIPYTGFMFPENKIEEFINSNIYRNFDTVLIGNYGALQKLQKDKTCILDTSMNIYNSYASNFFESNDFICALEMSKKQLRNLQTNNSVFYTVYGYIETMISKYCPISEQKYNKKIIGCNACKKGNYALLDRKNESFPIRMDDKCFLHLYHNKPLYIDDIENLAAEYLVISLTIESIATSKAVLKDYFNQIINGKKSQNKTNMGYTTGYYYD